MSGQNLLDSTAYKNCGASDGEYEYRLLIEKNFIGWLWHIYMHELYLFTFVKVLRRSRNFSIMINNSDKI
jgi:hypothetical protein